MINRPHQFVVSSGKIIIDRHHMTAFSEQRVQISWQGCGKCLALARFHFSDVTARDLYTGVYLAIIRHHLQSSFGCERRQRKCFRD